LEFLALKNVVFQLIVMAICIFLFFLVNLHFLAHLKCFLSLDVISKKKQKKHKK